jgi:hypothetical protein
MSTGSAADGAPASRGTEPTASWDLCVDGDDGAEVVGCAVFLIPDLLLPRAESTSGSRPRGSLPIAASGACTSSTGVAGTGVAGTGVTNIGVTAGGVTGTGVSG